MQIIADRGNYLKGMLSLLSDNSKFTPLDIDKSKRLKYMVNLEKKLKEHFKTLVTTKYQRMSLKAFALLVHALAICMDFLKSTKL